jgi:transcriptional/translational regulatory protein YebC/TACO1
VESDVEYVPSMEATPDEHAAKSLKKMIDILEENDDVQKVYHNCSLDLEEVE